MEETTGYTVLVVEDDPNHQLLIRRALSSEDSAFSLVQFARDSQDAEHFARQMLFDCLLVDNRIPGRRGLDLITYLRGEGVEAPFVLMTSVGNEDLAVQAYRNKVADYVIKDTGFWKELPQILTRVVQEHRSRIHDLELRGRLERTNRRLDSLNTEVQLHNQQLRHAHAELEQRNAELQQAAQRLAESRAHLLDFTFVVSLALGVPLEQMERVLAALGAAPDRTLDPGEVADLIDATGRVRVLAGRLREMSALSQLRDEAATVDIEGFLDRIDEGLRES